MLGTSLAVEIVSAGALGGWHQDFIVLVVSHARRERGTAKGAEFPAGDAYGDVVEVGV